LHNNKDKSEKEVTEAVFSVLDGVAKFIMWVGLVGALVGVGFLVYYVVLFSGAAPKTTPEQAKSLIETFRTVATAGLLALFVGAAYLFWGEAWMEVAEIFIALGCIFAPNYVPLLLSPGAANPVALTALLGLQRAGMGAGVVAAGVILIDVFAKVQSRMRQGIKADQLKYGKGIKEETDRRNVFMGKCWQLPYCRKFVRERCPIYHAKRTCWREKVGCMCEEEVIKGAMENRAIPKDMVAAARYIPQNNKLTLLQKMERCRHCVIYNEHQKHKYRLLLPLLIVFFVAFYAVFWKQLMLLMHSFVSSINAGLARASLNQAGNVAVPEFFQVVMLACFGLVALAYALKFLEFVIFKLKV
jgi:hypothetical protein